MSVISGSAADIVAAIGATFVTNAMPMHQRYSVGVTNDAATANLGIFILGKCCFRKSATKVSSANLSLFLLLVFYQQQDLH
jgi:hypothetical protein